MTKYDPKWRLSENSNVKMASICFQFFAHFGARFQYILINLQFTQHFD